MQVVAAPGMLPVLRDYAAQHLSLWIVEPENGQPGERNAQNRSAGLELLCRMVGDPTIREQSLPGTILLALGDLANRQPEVMASHWDELDRSLAALIISVDTPRSRRLSAIHTAATAGRAGHLAVIRHLVAAPRSD